MFFGFIIFCIFKHQLKDVIGMVSAQEEEVPFSNIIYPADAKGMVIIKMKKGSQWSLGSDHSLLLLSFKNQ